MVAWSVFILVWNTRHTMSHDALLFPGISFLFVRLIDLVHTFAYKGMGIISSDRGANPATQLWMAARYMEGVCLLIFPLFLTRTLRYYRTIALYAGVTVFLFGAIFYQPVFPVCYVEGTGLTPYQKNQRICDRPLFQDPVILLHLRAPHSIQPVPGPEGAGKSSGPPRNQPERGPENRPSRELDMGSSDEPHPVL